MEAGRDRASGRHWADRAGTECVEHCHGEVTHAALIEPDGAAIFILVHGIDRQGVDNAGTGERPGDDEFVLAAIGPCGDARHQADLGTRPGKQKGGRPIRVGRRQQRGCEFCLLHGGWDDPREQAGNIEPERL